MGKVSIKNIKIVQPIYIFISTRKKYWVQCVISLLISLAFFAYFCLFDIDIKYNIIELFDKYIDALISGISILLSFSIAVLTIFVTSNNESIDILKKVKADKKYKELKLDLGNEKDGKLNLYQVLLSGITYSILVQIIFLLLLFFEMFIKTVIDVKFLKVLVSINVFITLNIFFVLYEIVLNLFYTFWNTKSDSSK